MMELFHIAQNNSTFRTTSLQHAYYTPIIPKKNHKICQHSYCVIIIKATSTRFKFGKKLPSDVTVLFEAHINYFTLYVGKSTFVLLALLILGLDFPLSNRFCRCSGIVLQYGCQVASRVTGICGESIIHGITSEITKQRAGCVFVLW